MSRESQADGLLFFPDGLGVQELGLEGQWSLPLSSPASPSLAGPLERECLSLGWGCHPLPPPWIPGSSKPAMLGATLLEALEVAVFYKMHVFCPPRAGQPLAETVCGKPPHLFLLH